MTGHENKLKSDSEKRFTLRMNSVLFKAISIMAKQHKRSVAKEIEYAVEKYVTDKKVR